MADIDAVMAKVVNDIWAEFDSNGDGKLDRDETKEFVRSTLNDMDE